MSVVYNTDYKGRDYNNKPLGAVRHCCWVCKVEGYCNEFAWGTNTRLEETF